MLWDSAYLVVTTVIEAAHLRMILDNPAGATPITRHSVPPDYAGLALRSARIAWAGLAQDIAYNAQLMQISLSDQARSIYFLSGMHRLQGLQVAISGLHAGPITFKSYLHQAARDPFGLLQDLRDSRVVTIHDTWQLFRFHQSIEQTGLYPQVWTIASSRVDSGLLQITYCSSSQFSSPLWWMVWLADYITFG